MRQRHTCPLCHEKHVFKRYIDTDTGQYLADHVGRCNREIRCGYHYTPKDYFADNRIVASAVIRKTPVIPLQREPSSIPHDVYVRSLNYYHHNNFVQYLIRLFGSAETRLLCDRYHIGTSRHWEGATVFWQVAIDGRRCTGKIMLYDEHSGKRVKEPYSHITWAHTALHLPDYELRQCLFGETLLNRYPENDKPVALVESEKTAIIASVYHPEYLWLACGGLSNLSEERCKVLAGFRVRLFPDLGGYDKWVARARELAHITDISVSRSLELCALPEERDQGLDIADYLLQFKLAS